jgi:hypothetical protein
MPKKKLKTYTPEFKHEGFPVIIVHMDGKNLEDTKTCYFDSEYNAEKYVERSKMKKTDYQIYIKDK